MPSLMRYINVISRCGAVWRGDKLKDTDIGAAHTSYILTVCRHPGISQDKIAKRTYINKSNVTRNLAYLESCGYVERRQSAVREWNRYLTEDLSDEEMEMFMSMLSRLAGRAAEYAKVSIEAEDDSQ